jgi:hypothetical protein
LTHFFDQDYQKMKWRGKTLDLLKESHRLIRAPCLPEMLKEVSTKNETFQEFVVQKKNASYLFEPHNPHAQFTKQCIDGNLPPLPVLAHVKGHTLVLNRYALSEVVTKGLSKAIPHLSQLQVLHLDENGLTDASGAMIVHAVAQQGNIHSFFYTRNAIGNRFIEAFEALSEDCLIKELSFRGCRVLGGVTMRVVKCLPVLKTLSKLNLAELSLPDDVSTAIGKYLRYATLRSLDISWNSLSVTSAMTILSGMMHNSHLRFLDLSWNKLTDPHFVVANALMKVLRTHSQLLHLELTFTNFVDEELVVVLQGLAKSTSVLALHLSTGLDCNSNTQYCRLIGADVAQLTKSESADSAQCPFIGIQERPPREEGTQMVNLRQRDQKGVLKLKHRDDLVNIHTSTHFRKPKLGSEAKTLLFTRVLGHPRIKDSETWLYTQHCWVCEGWSFIELQVREQDLVQVTETSRFQHRNGRSGDMLLKTSMNDWFELAMDPAIDGWCIELLAPPGKHLVWFVRGEAVMISKQLNWKMKWGVKTNLLSVGVRSEELKVVQAKRDVKVRQFEKSKSVFRTFIEDNERLLDAMYTRDMELSKLSRVLKKSDELQEVASLLRFYFKDLKNIFEFCAASSNYPTIGWLDFGEFCASCQMLDKKHLNTSAIDRVFIAVNVDSGGDAEGSARELGRYAFLEILVRMALCKYQDLQVRPVEMLRRLLEEHVLKYGTPSQASLFRKEKIYSLPVNDLLEANHSQLVAVSPTQLFSKYRERNGKWLVLESIRTILDKAGLSVNDRELVKAFAFSKMSVVDESTSGAAHTRMQLVEFMEFFCRLADLLSPVDEPLEVKIEQAMDAIFSANGLYRKRVNDYGSEPSDIEV